MTMERREMLITGFLKWIGLGGIIAMLTLAAWGGRMSFQLASTMTESHENDEKLQTLGINEQVADATLKSVRENVQLQTQQLIVFDSRLAKMERNLIRLCFAARAKCED